MLHLVKLVNDCIVVTKQIFTNLGNSMCVPKNYFEERKLKYYLF